MSALFRPSSSCWRPLLSYPAQRTRPARLISRHLSLAPPQTLPPSPTSCTAIALPKRLLTLFRPNTSSKPQLHFFSTSFPLLSARPLTAAFFSYSRALSTAATLSASPTASFPTDAEDASPRPLAFDPEPQTLPLPPISPPSVGYWLLALAAMSFGIVVVGGVTRLTESGLSITEWRPVTGTLPPLSKEEWEREFDKYKATPEFKMLNAAITLDAFKRIYYMEYTHRLLGRFIGLALLLPFGYLLVRRRLTPGLSTKLSALTLLLGAQGFLGWYMVASGLKDTILTTPGAVPRVSQYRLAAHLGAALVFYAGLVGAGLAVLRDAAFVRGHGWRANGGWERAWAAAPGTLRRFRGLTWAVGGLVFVTAMSGAFVAGLDAGLIYNEFPLMGGRLVPPAEELVRPEYSQPPRTQNADGAARSQPWRNLFENPTTVQFDHRLLATTTYVATGGLWLYARAIRGSLPLPARNLAALAFGLANLQVALGITTLIYFVPVPLAAMHQAGSVLLLTCFVALGAALRRPGKWARVWRDAVARGAAGVKKL